MTTLSQQPDATGRFGDFGGRYVPETLIAALDQLAAEYEKAKTDEAFQAEFQGLLTGYVGRPTALTLAARLTRHARSTVESETSSIVAISAAAKPPK